MGLVEQQQRAVLLLQCDDLGERAEVAVHAEDRLGDDEDAGVVGGLGAGGLEQAGEFLQVVVGEDADGGAGEAGTIDQAGVAELVEDDGVALAGEGGQDADGGGEAG